MECCEKCFNEPALIDHIRTEGYKKTSACQYCGEHSGQAISLADLEEDFLKIAKAEYVSSDNISQSRHINPSDGLDLSEWFQTDFDVFSEKVKDPEELLNAILNASCGPGDPIEHEKHDCYFRKSDDWGEFSLEEYSWSMWEGLKVGIKKYGHALPLMVRTKKIDPEILSNYNELLVNIDGVRKAVPGEQILYRARIGTWTNIDDLRAPPPEKARGSRCSLQGQSALYLADSEDTAMAEVRPAKHDVVTVAAFRATRRLEICDFLIGNFKTSPFRDFAKYQMERDWIEFSKTLGEELGRPVRPSDEAAEYLNTQILCGMIFESGYDGISYPSAQNNGGKNYVFIDIESAQPVPGSIKTYVASELNYKFNLK